MTTKKPNRPPDVVPLTAEQEKNAADANAGLEKKLGADAWKEVTEAILKSCPTGMLPSGAVQPCKRVSNRNCVEPNTKTQTLTDPKILEKINEDKQTKVDWQKMGSWEGNQHLDAYVPWWPDIKGVENGKIILGSKGAVAGGNASGVTVGTGVDLGQQGPSEYKKSLREAGASEELIKKLAPYIGLKRGDACKYLRDHPLTLTKAEADLVDREMNARLLESAKSSYDRLTKNVKGAKPFTDLHPAEQTVLMSRQFQDGNITIRPASQALVSAMATGDRSTALLKLDVSGYNSDAHKHRIPAENSYLTASYESSPAKTVATP